MLGAVAEQHMVQQAHLLKEQVLVVAQWEETAVLMAVRQAHLVVVDL
jgi:hypothetical protein